MSRIWPSVFSWKRSSERRWGIGRIRGEGFTLSEILIVVVIIGILATLIVPRFAGQAKKAETAEAIEIMSVLRQSLLHYYDEHGGYPPILQTSAEIENTLRISWTPPRYGWTFSTTASGEAIAQKSIGNTLILNPDGTWDGTGDYDPATGDYWPNLN